jgi:hypothetical protein
VVWVTTLTAVQELAIRASNIVTMIRPLTGMTTVPSAYVRSGETSPESRLFPKQCRPDKKTAAKE